MSEISEARSELEHLGISIEGVDALGSVLLRCKTQDLEETLAQFHNLAGVLPITKDRDFGALVLEHLAAGSEDSHRRQRLLKHALYRARWCAQASTGSGEGLARAEHIKSLEAKLGHPSTISSSDS